MLLYSIDQLLETNLGKTQSAIHNSVKETIQEVPTWGEYEWSKAGTKFTVGVVASLAGDKGASKLKQVASLSKMSKVVPDAPNVKKTTLIERNLNTPDIIYSEGQLTWAYVDNKQVGFFEYDMNGGVSIELNIPNELKGKGVGSAIFREAVDEADSFKGLWVRKDIYDSGISDNLVEFNSNVASGMTDEAAAWATWSGRQATKNGFTNVIINRMENGNIQATFYR